ncbi:MAG: hypothetical protein HW405_305 [Candidatus Berkelbacteria bacterium]|nr:hypothetical protein [Candidatus Berkelbacteria bacterium]
MSETAPVFEQIGPKAKQDIEKLQENYTIAPDGCMVKINDYLANPETVRDETK